MVSSAPDCSRRRGPTHIPGGPGWDVDPRRLASAHCPRLGGRPSRSNSRRVLIERIKVLLRRTPFQAGFKRGEATPSKTLERGHLYMDEERHACSWKGKPITLTVTEFLLLQALAIRPGVVKSRDALIYVANDDQAFDAHIDVRIIDSHIKRLRRKFRAVDNRCDVIQTLHGVGYCFGIPTQSR